MGLFILWRYTNEDDPPLNYTITQSTIANAGIASATTGLIAVNKLTNETGTPYTVNLTYDDYMRMGHWNVKHVTLNSTKPTSCKIGGKYKFGQCKMDIKTISASDRTGKAQTSEEWAQSGNVPIFPENVSVIVLYDNAYVTGWLNGSTTGLLTNASVRMTNSQLIQFKDLSLPYKFPTPSYCIPGSGTQLNGDIAFFTRGAGYT